MKKLHILFIFLMLILIIPLGCKKETEKETKPIAEETEISDNVSEDIKNLIASYNKIEKNINQKTGMN